METVGIKETKEVLVALNKLVIKIAPIVIDGLSVSDLVAALTDINGDPVAKAELEAALADIKQVPVEIKDLTISEGIELGMVQAQAVPALIAAFKKPGV